MELKAGDKFKIKDTEWEIISVDNDIVRARTIYNETLYELWEITKDELEKVVNKK